MKKSRRYMLKIYWSDDITVECRYFSTKYDAEDYAKHNVVDKYVLVPM